MSTPTLIADPSRCISGGGEHDERERGHASARLLGDIERRLRPSDVRIRTREEEPLLSDLAVLVAGVVDDTLQRATPPAQVIHGTPVVPSKTLELHQPGELAGEAAGVAQLRDGDPLRFDGRRVIVRRRVFVLKRPRRRRIIRVLPRLDRLDGGRRSSASRARCTQVTGHSCSGSAGNFDRDTIVAYQAYNDRIADAALCHGRFAEPFSRSRMTWVKPSFLWMMERSGWGTKANQERTLAVA